MAETPKLQQLTTDELKAKFVQACEMQEANALSDALTLYNELLLFLPESPLIHFNMGLALFDIGDFAKAEEHYAVASQENHNDPDIPYNRGLNYRRLENQEEAINNFLKAIALGDSSVDTLYNLALCHQDRKEFEKAAKIYDGILENDKNHQPTLNNFAYLCHKTGDLKKAEQLYKRLLQLNPQHTAAQHMLNALCGTTPDNAPLEYIESVFDGYAENFEESLLKDLCYQTPAELWRFYREYFPETQDCKCLDLGCGTGLAGVHFEPACNELTGIDISDKILKVAKQKNLYKQLIKDDILSFLKTTKESFNLLIAADVFTYMGDLEPLFTACLKRCDVNGVLCFSVESSEDDSFSLKDTGRFGHPRCYIEKVCKKTGWQLISAEHSNLRQDKNEWISGYLVIFQK
jgi:predicted TPR repeat methyltransferase